jgi:hypothetical protein
MSLEPDDNPPALTARQRDVMAYLFDYVSRWGFQPAP